jgi:hypothetical protein
VTPDEAGWADADEPAEAATLPDVAGGMASSSFFSFFSSFFSSGLGTVKFSF